jgi:hypothetical protein
VLIGANGSGKSNLLGVFRLLADLAEDRLQNHIGRQGGANAILHFGLKHTSKLRIKLRFSADGYEAVLVPRPGDTMMFDDESILSYRSATPISDSDAVPRIRLGSGHKETELSVHPPRPHGPFENAERVLDAMIGWRPFHFHDTRASSPTK